MGVSGDVEQSFEKAAPAFASLSSCEAVTMPLFLDIVVKVLGNVVKLAQVVVRVVVVVVVAIVVSAWWR